MLAVTVGRERADIGMLCPQSKPHNPPGKGISLLKLASGVLRAASSVP